MRMYLLVGTVYVGGGDFFSIGRQFERKTFEFQAATDEEAKRIVSERYGNVTGHMLYREVE